MLQDLHQKFLQNSFQQIPFLTTLNLGFKIPYLSSKFLYLEYLGKGLQKLQSLQNLSLNLYRTYVYLPDFSKFTHNISKLKALVFLDICLEKNNLALNKDNNIDFLLKIKQIPHLKHLNLNLKNNELGKN